MKIKVARTLALAFGIVVAVSVCRAGGQYHVLKKIPVGWTGGCSSLAMDEMSQRLYAVCGKKIEVMDLRRGNVIGQITNAFDIRGFDLASGWRRAFMCNGHEPEINIVDLMRLRVVHNIKTDKNPDAILFDSRRSILYAFNEADDSVSMYEADDGDYVGTVKLPGKPGVAVTDRRTGKLYCCLKDKNELVVLDPSKRKITDKWDILPKGGVSAMAIDSNRHQLFLGGRDATVLMVDDFKGTELGGIAVNGPIDGMAFDPFGGRLYVSAGGSLVVAIEYTATELKVIQTLDLQKGPQAMAFDARAHKAYLAPQSPGAIQDNSSAGGKADLKATKENILVCGQ